MIDFYLSVLQTSLCLCPMALGIFISMKVFNIPDISTDGTYTLGACTTVVLLTQQFPLGLTLLLSVLLGAMAGMVTGLIHTKLKIDALLSGILVMTALYSINLIILGRSNLPLQKSKSIFSLIDFSSLGYMSEIIVSLIIVFIILATMSYLLRSDYGIAMRATGSNPVMTKAMGINNDRIRITGLAIANGLTSLSGSLIAQDQHYADINMGIGIVITGLGSVLIADTIRNWFRLQKIGKQLILVLIGVLIFQLVLAITLNWGVDPNMLKLITALFVLIIVALPRLTSNLAGKKI
jgi:putative ABC transport system permease protein